MSEATDWVEQARRLVAGLGQSGLGQSGLGQSGLGQTGPGQAGPGPGWADAGGEGHVPGGDCRWCPVCQLAAVARRPEVSEALADALTSAATALRAFAAAAEADAAAAAAEAATPQEGTTRDEPAATSSPVQHIEIG